MAKSLPPRTVLLCIHFCASEEAAVNMNGQRGGGGNEEKMKDRKEKMVFMWGYLPGSSPQRSPLIFPSRVLLLPSVSGDSWKDVCDGGCGFGMLETHLQEAQIEFEKLVWEKKELEEQLQMAIKDRRVMEMIVAEIEEDHGKAIIKIKLLENEVVWGECSGYASRVLMVVQWVVVRESKRGGERENGKKRMEKEMVIIHLMKTVSISAASNH